MKRFNRSLILFMATLTSVALLAFGQESFAAKAGDERTNRATIQAARPSPWQPAVIVKSPPTLSVAAPSGNTLRLVYVPNEGWRFADRAIETKANRTALASAAIPQPQEDSASDQPLTVFIDGPSGYTYVWMRWKFVGRITDPKH